LSVFGKVVLALVIAGGLLFAFQGGEYSTMDLWRQRQRKLRLQAETDSLARELDSLRQVVKAVQTDRATQERIAREEFGMVRGDKEIIYRLDGQRDSASRR
jgi:cell division protein FtsB